MTALERIKHLEKVKKSGDWPIEHYDGVFLLKAFRIMRELAVKAVTEGRRSPHLILRNAYEIERLFEQRMKDEETNV